MNISTVIFIAAWLSAVVAYFRSKYLIKIINKSLHDKIFGKHWSDHSIKTSSNYMKLVLSPKEWRQFQNKELEFWLVLYLISAFIVVIYVFYPIVRAIYLYATYKVF